MSDMTYPAGTSAAPAPRDAPAATRKMRTPLPVVLMLILVIMVPIEFSATLGGLFLTPAKVFLVFITFLMLPRIFKLKFHFFDWLIIAHVAWSVLTTFTTFGSAGTEGAGLYLLEFLIVYLVMRVYMTDLGQFRALVGFLFLLVAFSALTAVPEALTGRRYIHEFGRSITGLRYPFTNEYRMGILRAASFFEHQILFGIFCSAMLALVWFTSNVSQRMLKVPFIFLGTFLAASSAPLLAFGLQAWLIGIEWATRSVTDRVAKITGVAVVLGSALQFGTDRGVVGTLALLTLNPGTAYHRRSQWNFGIKDVMQHPLFGFDPRTWTRPFWMAPSVDNNWLLMLMRSGFPGIIFLFVGIFFIWRALAARGPDVPLPFSQMRKGWGVMIIAVLFTGATVAFFGKLQPMFSFYIGFGAALAACPFATGSQPGTAIPAVAARPAYTRFPGGATAGKRAGAAAGRTTPAESTLRREPPASARPAGTPPVHRHPSPLPKG